MEEDTKYQSDVVEKTLIILDKLDELNKVSICAELFKNLIRNKISIDQYKRQLHVIDRVFLPDLRIILKMNNKNNCEDKESTNHSFNEDESSLLLALGLITTRFDVRDAHLYQHFNLAQNAKDLIVYGGLSYEKLL